ncbi:UvrABC system protein [Trichinella spiralis]|uniref:UvrABC system protein n=1 Tax=Trichinella spiralis TaxID=6334 RepID=A0ABR3KAX0_TRISP
MGYRKINHSVNAAITLRSNLATAFDRNHIEFTDLLQIKTDFRKGAGNRMSVFACIMTRAVKLELTSDFVDRCATLSLALLTITVTEKYGLLPAPARGFVASLFTLWPVLSNLFLRSGFAQKLWKSEHMISIKKCKVQFWGVMCNCAIHCVLMSAVSRHSSFVWFYVLDLYF